VNEGKVTTNWSLLREGDLKSIWTLILFIVARYHVVKRLKLTLGVNLPSKKKKKLGVNLIDEEFNNYCVLFLKISRPN